MTDLTRQEIIDAHTTLEYLIKNLYDIPLEEAKHTTSYERLAKFLPPKPLLTMNDIKWDDNEHFLAEAENRAWGKVIMLFKKAKTGKILSRFHEDGEQCFVCLDPCDLAPTGKRYGLTEVQE